MGALSFTTLALSSIPASTIQTVHTIFVYIGTRGAGAFTLNICSDLNIGPPGNSDKPFMPCTDVFICLSLVYSFWLNVKTATVLQDDTMNCERLQNGYIFGLNREPSCS